MRRLVEFRVTDHTPVKLECVWTVTVSCILVKVLWQVDNLDSFEWAFLYRINFNNSVQFVHT